MCARPCGAPFLVGSCRPGALTPKRPWGLSRRACAASAQAHGCFLCRGSPVDPHGIEKFYSLQLLAVSGVCFAPILLKKLPVAATCDLKQCCRPNTPARKVLRDFNEEARDVAKAIAATPAYERSRHRRKKAEMLFAHLKRILHMARLRLRGPCGARDEFLLAATAQNLRRLAKLRPPMPLHGIIAA